MQPAFVREGKRYSSLWTNRELTRRKRAARCRISADLDGRAAMYMYVCVDVRRGTGGALCVVHQLVSLARLADTPCCLIVTTALRLSEMANRHIAHQPISARHVQLTHDAMHGQLA